MEAPLSSVHLLFVNLLAPIGTSYQQQNVQSLLAALLSQFSKTLYHNRWKSASALSLFLSQVQRGRELLIVMIRAFLLSQLLAPIGQGMRPALQIMVDFTSIPKQGKCRRFRHWLHYLHNCFGLHVVVIYLCCGDL